jgi:hypothetical protein
MLAATTLISRSGHLAVSKDGRLPCGASFETPRKSAAPQDKKMPA